jgi:hypothetical protein
MSFRRKDFHGGRAYDPYPPEEGNLRLGSRVRLLIAWVKLQLSRLTPDSSTSVGQGLSRRKSEGFSLLGSIDERHVQVRKLDTQVFPMAQRRERRQGRLDG